MTPVKEAATNIAHGSPCAKVLASQSTSEAVFQGSDEGALVSDVGNHVFPKNGQRHRINIVTLMICCYPTVFVKPNLLDTQSGDEFSLGWVSERRLSH